MNSFECIDLGLVDYQSAYELQKKTVEQVICGQREKLFLCEHPSILTMGRLATEKNILVPKSYIEKQKIDILRIDRGGEITLHTPGQLVIYPIMDLTRLGRDLRLYMSKLEQLTIDLLQYFGIVANRVPGQRGVWVQQDKIASIGIGVRRWISFHGLALNVSCDLSLFHLIRPCGLDVKMTSIEKLLNKKVDINLVKEKLKHLFSSHFDCELIATGD